MTITLICSARAGWIFVIYFEYDETATSTNAAVYAWANSVGHQRQPPRDRWEPLDSQTLGSFGPQGQTIYNALWQ